MIDQARRKLNIKNKIKIPKINYRNLKIEQNKLVRNNNDSYYKYTNIKNYNKTMKKLSKSKKAKLILEMTKFKRCSKKLNPNIKRIKIQKISSIQQKNNYNRKIFKERKTRKE